MKKILVPTDFSEAANQALEFASVIAQSWSAEITLLSVYTPAVSRFNMVSPSLAELNQKLQQMANIIKQEYPGVTCHVEVGTGETVEGILNASRSAMSDLIIMATQGASSIEKVLLGSNAAEVIEKADCPVLVVPGNTVIRIPKKIVFATDYAQTDIEGARMVASMAQIFEATITFIHITKNEEVLAEEKKVIDQFTNEVKAATGYANITSKIISDNSVFMGLDFIVEHADADVDLIALSTRRRSLFEKIYNPSLTKKLARYTHIPLLAFKAQAEHKK